MVSETNSRNPKVRMNPSERKRVRIHPRMPTEANASLFQICSSNVSSADRTVVCAEQRVVQEG
jgi:hypothetical protein